MYTIDYKGSPHFTRNVRQNPSGDRAPVLKSKLYKNVNVANATLDNVNAFAQAMAALSEWPLDQVILSTDQEIIEVIG